MLLRPYQQKLSDDVYAAWGAGNTNVLAVAPTGSGKTVLFSSLLSAHGRAAAAIAHRGELVSQISLSLAEFGVRHRIVGPTTLVREVTRLHHMILGKSFVDPNAAVGAVSIDTLRSRYKNKTLEGWSKQVSLWVQDEAHHVLKKNKWGLVSEIFPNAYGLGVTATPLRADGQGLGRHADGLFDCMIEGPGMRDLIDAGYLSDYRIYAPPSDMDLTDVKIGSTGDYTPKGLKSASEKSHIIGDVVDHYLKIAPGKLGITFATDIETAIKIKNQYLGKGVKTELITGDTPATIRAELLRRFRNREIDQLVNVDLFGEGFDLPALEVVSMARPTQSFGLYAQQFGRALRPFPGKRHGIIIDHVGNVVRHGLPDAGRAWTLDRRDKKSRQAMRDEVEPVKSCVNDGCWRTYSGFLSACPHCGHRPEPTSRTDIKFVDGDLVELDAKTLARMRGEVVKIDLDAGRIFKWAKGQGKSNHIAQAMASNHRARQGAQTELRELMSAWGGVHHAAGATDSEIQRRFYWKFGVDVMTAQTLGSDALPLMHKIKEDIGA